MTNNLERLYQEAKSALAAKEYDRAADLLRQILLQDHDYKDASRLLAQTIRLKRRRWYNDPRVWSVAGILAVAAILVWLVPRFSIPDSALAEQPTASSIVTQEPKATQTQIAAQIPTATPIPTVASTPSPTPLPLVWKRVSMGLELRRDQVTAIAVDPHDPDVFYVGTQQSGIYKSIDGGLSWQSANDGIDRVYITSLIVDPDNPSTIYANADSGGIYKSMDGAKNWLPINNGIDYFDGGGFDTIVIDPTNSQHLYDVTGWRLYQSIDGGVSWEYMSTPLIDRISNFVIHPSDGNTIYIGDYRRVFRSTDAGKNWTYLARNPALTNFEFTEGSLHIDPRNANTLYISNCNHDKPYSCTELNGSFDGGQTWQYLNRKTCNVMAFDPEDENITYCGSEQSEIWVSKDNGRNWTMPLVTQNPGNIKALTFSPSQKLLAGGLGFYMSDDNGISLIPYNSGLGSGNAQLIFSEIYDSKLFIEDNDQKYRQQIYFSQDGGNKWLPWEGERSILMADYKDVLQLFKNQAGQKLYAFGYIEGQTYGGQGPIYHYTKDNGITWLQCGLTGTNPRQASNVNCLVIDPRDDEKIYLATYGGGIWTSVNGCKSWQTASQVGLGSLFVNSLAIDANNPDTIYAGTDGGAFVSFDGTNTWTEINDGLLGAKVVYSIVVDSDSNVYASTPYGIFKLEKE